MVHSGSYPKKIETVRDNLERSRNVFAEDNQERADWVDDVRNAPEDRYIRDRAETVYFTGCVAAYFPLGAEDSHCAGANSGRERRRFHTAGRR